MKTFNEWKYDQSSKIKQKPKDDQDLINIIIQRLEKNIEEPDLSDIDVSDIEDFSLLFCGYEDYIYLQRDIDVDMIKKLDLSSWDVSNVKNMSEMFARCISLKEIDITGWDTSKVSDMSSMFLGCKSLKTIKGIENIDVSNVTNMGFMFSGCRNLEELDLSLWKIPNFLNTTRMFYKCKKLKVLKGVESWILKKLKDVTNMFKQCPFCPRWYDKNKYENND